MNRITFLVDEGSFHDRPFVLHHLDGFSQRVKNLFPKIKPDVFLADFDYQLEIPFVLDFQKRLGDEFSKMVCTADIPPTLFSPFQRHLWWNKFVHSHADLQLSYELGRLASSVKSVPADDFLHTLGIVRMK